MRKEMFASLQSELHGNMKFNLGTAYNENKLRTHTVWMLEDDRYRTQKMINSYSLPWIWRQISIFIVCLKVFTTSTIRLFCACGWKVKFCQYRIPLHKTFFFIMAIDCPWAKAFENNKCYLVNSVRKTISYYGRVPKEGSITSSLSRQAGNPENGWVSLP